MSKRIALGLLTHYAEHEAEILEKLSRFYFADYMRLVGRMLPKAPGEGGPDLETMSAEDTASVAGAVRAALERVEAGEGSLAEIEAALAGAAEGATVNIDALSAPARPVTPMPAPAPFPTARRGHR